MKVVEKTAKTVDEALYLALSELKLSEENVEIEILEKPKPAFLGFIGGRLAKIKVYEKNYKSFKIAIEFLEKIFFEIGINIIIEKENINGYNKINIYGKELDIFIGKNGDTLDSLQYLTNLIVFKKLNIKNKIIVDIENYRKKREENLKELVYKIAEKVKINKEKIILDPMKSHERKIIHLALQEDNNIYTLSEGKEPFRRVIINFKK